MDSTLVVWSYTCGHSRTTRIPNAAWQQKWNLPAITVECRISDKLVIRRAVDGLPDFEIVVCLQNLLPAVIQFAVTVEHVHAAGLQEFPVGQQPTRTARECKSRTGKSLKRLLQLYNVVYTTIIC